MHVMVSNSSLERFQGQATIINECLHAYGIHSATIQPELSAVDMHGMRKTMSVDGDTMVGSAPAGASMQQAETGGCVLHCGDSCEKQTCCG